MNDQIRNLIASSKLEEAIKLMLNNEDLYNDTLLISARLTRLNTEVTRGLINYTNESIGRAKITHALLSLLKGGGEMLSENIQIPTVSSIHLPTELQKIVADNFRRRPDVSDQAKTILLKFQEYQFQKSINPSYDVAGRHIDELNKEANIFLNSLNEVKKDELEEIVAKINKLLSARVPAYADLQAAYVLACGRGFSSNYIEKQLALQPQDPETQIMIAERIEKYIATLTVAK